MPAKSLDDEALDEITEDDFGEGIENEVQDDTPAPEVDEVEPEEEEEVPEVETVSVRSLAEKYGFPLDDGEDEVEVLDKFFGKIQQFAQQTRDRDRQYQDQLRQYQYQL